ncbi:MAG: hypothetical protein KF887_10260 [Paracoccaceae bacterium]|nr:MAG: hypothetical protein KF887_10260 [Paracoccaceae bacterium]
MKVNSHAIEKYLWMLTNGAQASQPRPMTNLADFDVDIGRMAAAARAAGEEDLLRIAIDSLVADPTGRIHIFSGQIYDFSDDELVDLLGHALDTIWPDHIRSLPGDGAPMEFIPMSDAEWAARQGKTA